MTGITRETEDKMFNFANLAGTAKAGKGARAAAAKAEDDDAGAMDGDDTLEAGAAEGMDDEDGVEAGDADADSDAEYDGDEMEASAAFRRGYAKGRRAERQRFAAIMAEATPETVELATHLAANTGLTVAQVAGSLRAAPRESALGQRMKGRDPSSPVRSDAGANGGGDDDAAVATRILANAGRTKRKEG